MFSVSLFHSCYNSEIVCFKNFFLKYNVIIKIDKIKYNEATRGKSRISLRRRGGVKFFSYQNISVRQRGEETGTTQAYRKLVYGGGASSRWRPCGFGVKPLADVQFFGKK